MKNDKSNREWINMINNKSESLLRSDKIDWFNSSQQMALTDLEAVLCLDCGYFCNESDLIDKRMDNSKEKVFACPKCGCRDMKYY